MVEKKPLSWYLNNGCSRHMTGERSMFQRLRNKKGRIVTFSGNQKGQIIGIGKMGINLFLSIENVLLFYGLQYNLLNISQLCDNKYNVIFEKC